MSRISLLLLTAVVALTPVGLSAASLGFSEQISPASFGALREVERHQLKVAEGFYLKDEFAVALDEYEKYLNLYADGPGAPYAQLMWAHCQRKLRHVNTAIRDGYQSVVDYWPDSDEAILATYLIPVSYKDMGEFTPARKAFREAIEAYPEHPIAFKSRVHLLDMAKVEHDEVETLALLEEFTFTAPRDDNSRGHCENASRELAGIRLRANDIAGATEALATTYNEDRLPFALDDHARDHVSHLHAQEETSSKRAGLALADHLIAQLEAAMPDDVAGEGRARTRDILYRQGGLYGRSGRGEQVFKNYERVAKLTGMDDELRGRYAASYKHRDERDQARVWYGRFENQIEGQRNIAAMFREEGWKEAIDAYGGLVQTDPTRAGEYHWTIAECYESSGDQKAAIVAFRLSDNYPRAYYHMARCHRRLKEYNEALGLYNQCKSIEGQAPTATLESAYTLEEAGRREAAISAFQTTCRSFPRSSQASRAHAHLQNKYQISITLGGAQDE